MWIALFFAWGFAMHAGGLLLHELGGHALAATVLACGIDGYKLTFFGHGLVHYADCTRWTAVTVLVCDLAGLAITIAAGAVAGLRARRAAPFVRLLLAMLALGFLLGQLAYATSGGFHRLYDPGRLARLLAARGLGPVAWIPPLVAYAAAAFFFARMFVVAFAANVGARARREVLRALARSLVPAGLLYLAAFRIERALRVDVAMRGVAVEAERLAAVKGAAAPFPIDLVLVAVAAAAFVVALARPLPPAATPTPRARPALVFAAAAISACVLAVFNLAA